ncbi:Rieske 2Fe-2S domain-containing protein [Hyphococcus sp.]|uniref:Rieske 2Fe-2S domain-containing protein n=1 Tax=Hyphococcus sp. TaxID=2038636 RepID=UPI0035C7027A
MALLKNVWHAAAWSQEVGDKPFARTIANEHILLYRKAGGSIVALNDTCPHRFAPLHRGKIVNGEIECGYHGLRFNDKGACVHNPHGDGTVPKSAAVKVYPVAEKDTLIWVWLGDPARADKAAIPEFPWLNETDTYDFSGGHVMHMPLAWDLILDNLLDLTHGAYLHPDTLAPTPDLRTETNLRRDGDRVYSLLSTFDAPPPPIWTATGAATGKVHVDTWLEMRWDAPATFFLDVGVMPTGHGREDGNALPTVHIITPETEETSHYFWKMFRNFSRGNPKVSEVMEEFATRAFQDEDRPMIRAVQERMAGRDFWEMDPVLLPTDAAAIQARRMIKKLLKEEADEAAGGAARS